MKTVKASIVTTAMLFSFAHAAFAADWTDANNATYTALKSINGGGSGYIATDFTPVGTDTVKFKFKPSTVSGNECIYCSRNATGTKSMSYPAPRQTFARKQATG